MLSPDFLDGLPDAAVKLWQGLEDEILLQMAKEIRSIDFGCPSNQWRMQRILATGRMREYIAKVIAKHSGESEKVVNQILVQAARESLETDIGVFKEASELYTVDSMDTKALNKVLRAGARQTADTMKNICAVTPTTAARQFESVLDKCWIETATGSFSLNAVIDRACNALADTGIQCIQYNGKNGLIHHVDNVEVAVRRAVRTGVNQTALKITEETCSQLGCDLVEVSAHAGARPSHALWQGQVYSVSGENPKYKKFSTATGYGTGAGLGGWNCRHSFAPYVEGSPRLYSAEKLKEMNSIKYHYDGIDMTEYDATQYQRSLERKIRKLKRRELVAGSESQRAVVKAQIRETSTELNDFLSQTDLKRRYEREQIYNR